MIIGVDSDWYVSAPEFKDVVLTSVMKNMDVAVFNAIKAVADGSFTGGTYTGTLKDDGVGIAPFHRPARSQAEPTPKTPRHEPPISLWLGASILAITGLGCCFDAVYSVESVGYRPKPMLSGFRALLRAERLDPRRCIMVEDSLANLVAAKKLGMKTVWVSAGSRRSPSVDAKITSVLELPSRCGRL